MYCVCWLILLCKSATNTTWQNRKPGNNCIFLLIICIVWFNCFDERHTKHHLSFAKRQDLGIEHSILLLRSHSSLSQCVKLWEMWYVTISIDARCYEIHHRWVLYDVFEKDTTVQLLYCIIFYILSAEEWLALLSSQSCTARWSIWRIGSFARIPLAVPAGEALHKNMGSEAPGQRWDEALRNLWPENDLWE